VVEREADFGSSTGFSTTPHQSTAQIQLKRSWIIVKEKKCFMAVETGFPSARKKAVFKCPRSSSAHFYCTISFMDICHGEHLLLFFLNEFE